MKAYKIFKNDWTCNGFKYEIGKTYSIDEKPKLCVVGFQACKDPVDCFKYYEPLQWNKFAEVEIIGDIDGPEDGCTKICTNKIKIVMEQQV